MEQAGVGPEMMQRCKVMMRAPIFLDSPGAIRGQAEALGLSEEQVKKLLDIENDTRKKARAVLTEEQTKKMGEVPDKPMAMMEKMMGSKGGPMMMCPMMRMMMGGQDKPQGSEAKQDK